MQREKRLITDGLFRETFQDDNKYIEYRVPRVVDHSSVGRSVVQGRSQSKQSSNQVEGSLSQQAREQSPSVEQKASLAHNFERSNYENFFKNSDMKPPQHPVRHAVRTESPSLGPATSRQGSEHTSSQQAAFRIEEHNPIFNMDTLYIKILDFHCMNEDIKKKILDRNLFIEVFLPQQLKANSNQKVFDSFKYAPIRF